MSRLEEIILKQKLFCRQQGMASLDTRIEALQQVATVLRQEGHLLIEALAADLGKSRTESMITELYGLQKEVKVLTKLLKKAKKQQGRRFFLEPMFLPAKGEVQQEAYGTVLILSPWNYPVQLAFMPLLGALAAGNTAILRISSKTPQTAEAVQRLVARALPEEMAVVVPHEVDPNLLVDLDVDYIFFTGSAKTGRKIAAKAAQRLIPTTLELGGKSPAIVTKDANLPLAAQRILFGKVLNAGQTCVAPDYVLADAAIADELVRLLAQKSRLLLPDGAMSKDYPRLVSTEATARLAAMIEEGPVAFGGNFSADGQKLVPTGIYPAHSKLQAMQEEIFGPVLPILPYQQLKNALRYINRVHPNPLALYVFSESSVVAEHILSYVPSGTAAINDTLLQVASSKMPFGGRGASGWGAYHGIASLAGLQHQKSILWQSSNIDPKLRYMPWSYGLERILASFIAPNLHN